MSDRIEELGSLARSLTHRLHLRLTEAAGAGYMLPDAQVTALIDAITKLATIALKSEARARKAEAMCERLVKFAADCDECPRTRYDEDEDGCRECLDSIRRKAERVIRG